MKRATVVPVALWLIGFAPLAAAEEPADTVALGGRIYTVDPNCQRPRV